MPFALIIVAVMLVVVGLRGTQSDLYCLLRADFSGQGNFLYWLGAVLLIGMIGYVPKLRPVSDAFLVLMIVALFVASKGGLFANITEAFGQTTNTGTTGTVSIGTLTIGDPINSTGTTTTQQPAIDPTTGLPTVASYLK